MTFLTYAASAYAAFNLLTISCPTCTTSPSNNKNVPSNILDSADAQARLGARILIWSILYDLTMVASASFGVYGVISVRLTYYLINLCNELYYWHQ